MNFIILFSLYFHHLCYAIHSTSCCSTHGVALEQVIYCTLKELSVRTLLPNFQQSFALLKSVTLALLSTSHRFEISQIYYRLQYICVALIETCQSLRRRFSNWIPAKTQSCLSNRARSCCTDTLWVLIILKPFRTIDIIEWYKISSKHFQVQIKFCLCLNSEICKLQLANSIPINEYLIFA